MVASDFHDPSGERLRGVVARQGAVSAYEGFLCGVLRALGGAEQLPAQSPYLAEMRGISLGKRRLLTHSRS